MVAVLAHVCDNVAGLKPFVRRVGRAMGNSIALHADDGVRCVHVQRISQDQFPVPDGAWNQRIDGSTRIAASLQSSFPFPEQSRRWNSGNGRVSASDW